MEYITSVSKIARRRTSYPSSSGGKTVKDCPIALLELEQQSLRHDDGHHEAVSHDDGGKDLGVQDVDAHPRGAGKSPERVLDGHVAPADDGGLEGAVVGAVEGDDGVLVGREERGLHADEEDLGGHDEESPGREGDEEDHQDLPGGVAVVLGDVVGLVGVGEGQFDELGC